MNHNSKAGRGYHSFRVGDLAQLVSHVLLAITCLTLTACVDYSYTVMFTDISQIWIKRCA